MNDITKKLATNDAKIKLLKFTQDLEQVEVAIIKFAKLVATNISDSNEIGLQFIDIFDLVFKESTNPNNLFKQLQQLHNKNQTLEYLSIVSSIYSLIENLPPDFPYKQMMLNKITDNCNIVWISKFIQNKYQLSEAEEFIKENSDVDIDNTIIIKTWGTNSEISSGLLHVVEQKLTGDDVGHASIVMRIKADDHALALIKKYCLENDGRIKVPYELKKYGNQTVYEIYWSYWPNKLHSIKDDIETEHNFEYRINQKVIDEMPEELKSLVILTKYRKGNKIILAPAATLNLSHLEVDSSRQTYIKLKKRKIELNEEINSIKVIIDHYLEKKIASKINPDSNLLVLLRRFTSDLAFNSTVATILTKKEISEDEKKILLNTFNQLKERKKIESNDIKEQLIKLGNQIQLGREYQKYLKSSIKSSRNELNSNISAMEETNNAVHFFRIKLNNESTVYPLKCPQNIIKILKDYPPPKIAISTPGNLEISKEDATYLFEYYKKYQGDIQKNIKPLETRIEQDIESLHQCSIDKLAFENLRLRVNEVKFEEIQREKNNMEHCVTEIDNYIYFMKQYPLQSISFTEINLEEKKQIKVVATYSTPSEARSIQKKILLYQQMLTEKQLRYAEKLKQTTKLNEGNEEYTDLLYIQQREFNKIQNELKIAEEKIQILQKFIDEMESEHRVIYKVTDPNSKNSIPTIKTFSNLTDALALKIELDDIYVDLIKKEDDLQAEITNILSKNQFLHLQSQIDRFDVNIKNNSICMMELGHYLENLGNESGISNDTHEITYYELNQTTKEIQSKTIKYKNIKEANQIQTSIQKSQEILLQQKESNQKQYVILQRLESTRSTEDIVDKSLERGFPSRDITLRNFDIEAMLAKASELAPTVDQFQLKKENCSTTSMKILQAGAPEEIKPVFIWSEAMEGDQFASNRFLTNPQSVYSASRIVEDYQLGIHDAQQKIQEAKRPLTNRQQEYYALLNSIAMSENNEMAKSINSFKKIVRLIFKFFPYIFQLGKDIRDFFRRDRKIEKKNTFYSQLANATKNQKTNQYDLIYGINARAAMFSMAKQLNEDNQSIPFFDNHTLNMINNYFDKLSTSAHLNSDDQTELNNYKAIINERNKRINIVSDALFTNQNTSSLLSKQQIPKGTIQWHLSNTELLQYKLATFMELYKNEQKNKLFSLFRSNFVAKLSKHFSVEEQIKTIEKHVAQMPLSTSAKIWKQCNKLFGLTEPSSLQQKTTSSPNRNAQPPN